MLTEYIEGRTKLSKQPNEFVKKLWRTMIAPFPKETTYKRPDKVKSLMTDYQQFQQYIVKYCKP